MARYGADKRPRTAFDQHTVTGEPPMDEPMNLEEVLQALYDSEINIAIS